MVNNQINESLELRILTDLDNQIKHGYPLTKYIRSYLNPKVENIRHELMMPLTIGWSHIPKDGRVVFEADILDDNDDLIIGFRELIENAIVKWEDFILINLVEKSDLILQKRKEKKEKDDKTKRILEDEDKVNLITSNLMNWREIPFSYLNVGMMVKVFSLD